MFVTFIRQEKAFEEPFQHISSYISFARIVSPAFCNCKNGWKKHVSNMSVENRGKREVKVLA